MRRLLALAILTAAPGVAAAQPLVVAGGEVHTGDGQVFANGMVFVEDGKITAVGASLDVPSGAHLLDAGGLVVTPGLIDALTRLGMNQQGDPTPGPGTRAAARFRENMAPDWLRAGVTAAYLAPDPRALFGGVGAVVKLAGSRPTAIVAEDVAVAASFGETAVGNRPPGRDPPAGRTTRQGMVHDLRDTLVGATEDRYTGATGRVLGRLLAGEMPLRVLANTPDDLETALRISREFELRLVLDQATGGALVADRLAEAGVPVVVGPSILGIGDGGPMEMRTHSPALAGRLHAAGVSIALSTFMAGGRDVGMEAVIAWAHGLPREAALTAVTSGAAGILGVADRIGTLAPGLDADIAIWDAHPIGTYARTRFVIVDGEIVFRRDP